MDSWTLFPHAWQNGCCTTQCHDDWSLTCFVDRPPPPTLLGPELENRSLFSIPRKTSPQLSEEQKQQKALSNESLWSEGRDGCHAARVGGVGWNSCPPAGWQCPLHDQEGDLTLTAAAQVSAKDTGESPAEGGPGAGVSLSPGWLQGRGCAPGSSGHFFTDQSPLCPLFPTWWFCGRGPLILRLRVCLDLPPVISLVLMLPCLVAQSCLDSL